MPHRAVWRGFLHSIGLAPLLELREVEEAKRLALEAAIHNRTATAELMAKRRREMAQVEKAARTAMQYRGHEWVERAGREAMQNQERSEPNRDGDPHDF
jgi:hypothetical protein